MKITYLVLLSAFCCSPIYAFTLPKQATKSYECNICSQLSHETLEDKWGIPNEPLDSKVNNQRKSYSYKEQVTLKQLQTGVVISTLAPGAVVRITPLQKKTIPQLQLKTPANQLMQLKEASSLYSQDEPLGDTLLETKHQTMFQIKPELGAGHFIIKSKTINPKDADTYMINVFDKFSLTYLQIESDSIHYYYGDKLTATITLKDNENDYSIDDIEVVLIGPQEHEMVPLQLSKIHHNQFKARIILDSEVNDHGENWYIEASIHAKSEENTILRNAHTAFSYSIPSASLLTIKKLSSRPLTFVATLDVATASRYALQSVLFHSDRGTTPLETSQKAQWLEPGIQEIQFTFDNSSQLSDDNLYLGYLRLLDYGQLKTVYQYNQAIKLTQLVE